MIASKPTRQHKPPAVRQVEILAAAAEVFAKHGYRGCEVQDVVLRAGVGKGTVYRFFPSKEALFLATLRHGLDQLRALTQAAVEDQADPLDKVRAAVRAYVRFFETRPEMVELFIQERAEFRDRSKPLYFLYKEAERQEWVALFQSMEDSGCLRPGCAQAALDALGYLLYGFVLSISSLGGVRHAEAAFEEIFELYLRGVLSGDRH